MATMSIGTALNALASDLFGSVFRFPLWWYTDGVLVVLKKAKKTVQFISLTTGFGVWSKNLTTPMYGDNSFAGRVISFFIRLAIVVFVGFGLILWIGFLAILVLLYLLFPVISLFGVLYHLFGRLS